MTREEFLALKPSELLRLALKDLEKVEAMPETYLIDFARYHEYNAYNSGKCVVCLAGSVLATSFGHAPTESIWLWDLDHEISDRIHCISDLQFGAIRSGLHVLGLPTSDVEYIVNQTKEFHDGPITAPYRTNPDGYKKWVARLADRLEELGY